MSRKSRAHLTPYTQPAFDSFVKLANKGHPHPLDWKRFYEFVNDCHRRRLSRTDSQMRQIFRDAGFPERVVDELALVYYHGRGLLKMRVWLGH